MARPVEGRPAAIVLGLRIAPPVEQQPRDLEVPLAARDVEGRVIDGLHAHGEARTSHAFAYGARRSRRVRAEGEGWGERLGLGLGFSSG